ncbi:sensor histidine kinase [Runella sp.]|uniref:sensor histidine kinase n=1 Tax=Runella sp. TaxID=1960881 RepID=UPI003D0DD144
MKRLIPFSDTKLRIFGPIVLFLIGTVFFRLNWYFELHTIDLLISDAIALTAGYICWESTRFVIRRLQKIYPGYQNTRRRCLWLLVAFPFFVFYAIAVRTSIRIPLGFVRHTPLPQYIYTIGIQIFYNSVYIIINEGFYVLREWQKSHAAKEALKKASLQTQLDSLKSQINPHFLFNSLNALTALITENPAKAETFVDEISSVYRYLLRNNEHELATVREEISFILSYFHLLKTRYGEGIQLHLDGLKGHDDFQLPPLTLQVLVENAVKHNAILPENPLMIDISIENNTLVVQNNVQRKTVRVASNRVGLANIAAKYRILDYGAIEIIDTDNHFTVRLPLITPTL